jgi:MFS family permease
VTAGSQPLSDTADPDAGSVPGEVEQARSAAHLMLRTQFGAFMGSKLLGGTALWVHSVVAAIVVFGATGSALAVGLISVVQFAPQLLLTPVSGALSDRGHTRVQMLVGRFLGACGSGVIFVWLLLAPSLAGWPLAWAVLVCSAVLGIGVSVGEPAQQTVTPVLVTRAELPVAMAFNTMPLTVARIAGPALGASVAVGLGNAWAFGLATAAQLASLAVLATLSLPPRQRGAAPVDYSTRAGLRHVKRDVPLLLLLVVIASVGVGSEPILTLSPVLAHEAGAGTGLIGILTAGFGVGAGCGLLAVALIGRRISQPALTTTGLVLLAAGMATGGVAGSPPWVVAGFFLAGIGFSFAMASASTLIQLRCPPELRGRVMALWMVAFAGSRPVSATALGALADAVNARSALGSVAVLLVIVAAVARPRALSRPFLPVTM